MNERDRVEFKFSQSATQENYAPVVYVVDDDQSIRESLSGLIRSSGWAVHTFASATEFLSRPHESRPSCLILDVTLPDLTGLELQRLIASERNSMPIIFITGHRDVPMTVQAMKAGAIDFLTKPFSTSVLMGAVEGALEQSRRRVVQDGQLQTLRIRYASLSPREHEVMGLVVRGKLNKQVGGDLGISEITVKAHRGKAMHKMQARSLADLVRIADILGVHRNSASDGGKGGALIASPRETAP
jgi:FixJ family two-component response regulator